MGRFATAEGIDPLVEVFTLWVSMVGSGLRPSLTRARPVRS
ncbi:hypothetical protein ABIE67_000333 [Streptomyces sp. V4I8]